MPFVTVQQSPRDVEQKRLLVSRIAQAFVDSYGVTPETVQVFIHEVADDNWCKAGRLALPSESERSLASGHVGTGASAA